MHHEHAEAQSLKAHLIGQTVESAADALSAILAATPQAWPHVAALRCAAAMARELSAEGEPLVRPQTWADGGNVVPLRR
jgi:hypothetical protein